MWRLQFDCTEKSRPHPGQPHMKANNAVSHQWCLERNQLTSFSCVCVHVRLQSRRACETLCTYWAEEHVSIRTYLQDDDGAYHGWHRPFRELVSSLSVPFFSFFLLSGSISIHDWTLVLPYFTTVVMFLSLPLWGSYRKGISPLSDQREVWGCKGCWNRCGAGEGLGWGVYRLGDIGVG